jgi:hypothetical protein
MFFPRNIDDLVPVEWARKSCMREMSVATANTWPCWRMEDDNRVWLIGLAPSITEW